MSTQNFRRLSPLEAKEWVLQNQSAVVTVSGSYESGEEMGRKTYQKELEDFLESLRHTKLLCLADDCPVFEINRILSEVKPALPVLTEIFEDVDKIRDRIANTIEEMISSGVWNHPIAKYDHQMYIGVGTAEAGMRLSQLRLIREISGSIGEIITQIESILYARFISGKNEDWPLCDANRDAVRRVLTERPLMCEWIESTLPTRQK